jgi:hypothetical protein
MSEHQIIAFRACEQPVSEKNLKYMESQSSRAEITPWSFDNEYHYGDFHGNTLEMLRRGYDLHLHYANFGIRKLLIRLPQGFPNSDAAKPYLMKDSICFLKDAKQGSGGTLSIQPFLEPDELEELWDIEDLVDQLEPLRAEILEGDLRPLYLAHLAVSRGSDHDPAEAKEGPVPAGLKKLSDAQLALAEFFGLEEALLDAAAQASPPLGAADDLRSREVDWLRTQPESKKDAWLARLLGDPDFTVRAEILAAYRANRVPPTWPTVRRDRTIAELQAAAEELSHKAEQKAAARQVAAERKAAEKAARERAQRQAAMAADSAPYLQETEQLVNLRGVDSYRQIGELLADLRAALAGSKQAGLAERQAEKLHKRNPTLSRLTSELRRHGFLPK